MDGVLDVVKIADGDAAGTGGHERTISFSLFVRHAVSGPVSC